MNFKPKFFEESSVFKFMKDFLQRTSKWGGFDTINLSVLSNPAGSQSVSIRDFVVLKTYSS